MGCSKSHLLISPDSSKPSNVIHFLSPKKSVVTPLPQSHHPVIPSGVSSNVPTTTTSQPPISSASTGGAISDETGLIYVEKSQQASDDNLIALCKKGKLNLIQDLLKKNISTIDINMKGMWGNTPLIIACQYHHPKVALFFLSEYSSKIDIFHMNDYGATAFLYSCLEGLEEVVQKLFALGAQPNMKPALIYNSFTDRSDYFTPLTATIINGHFDICKSLIISGKCDLNLKITQKSDQIALVDGKKIKIEVHDLTPLMIACKYQQKQIFQYLLAGDGNQSQLTDPSLEQYLHQDSEGSTILHYLCQVKRSPISSSSSSTGAGPGAGTGAGTGTGTSTQSSSPSSIALEMLNSFIESISNSQQLLKLLYLSDKKGSLPIHIASESTSVELVEALLKTEKHLIEGLTVDRNTPLQRSITQVSSMNAMGYTPLHISIKKRSTEVVKVLLEYGSDPYQPLVVNSNLREQRVSSSSSSSSQNNSEKCAYDAAMKLRQNTEIYQLLFAHHEKEQEALALSESPLQVALTSPLPTRTTQQFLLAQDTKEGEEVLASGYEECSGQELRIHEIVSSLSQSNATPKIPIKKRENGHEDPLPSSPLPGLSPSPHSSSSLATVLITTTATSLVEEVIFQTPRKNKSNFSSSSNSTFIPQTPLKDTENKKKSCVGIGGGVDDVMKISSPLLFADEELTIVSP